MSTGALLAVFLAVAAAAVVLQPLFRRDAAEAERRSSAMSEEQDLQSQREMALQALRDLEDDRATGKISDPDYEALKSKLSARAVAILNQLDRIGTGAGPAS